MQKLPPFPLPTHDVVQRYGAPCEFEVPTVSLYNRLSIRLARVFVAYYIFVLQRNLVAYDEDQFRHLEKALVLQDAISDLPSVFLSSVHVHLYLHLNCILN